MNDDKLYEDPDHYVVAIFKGMILSHLLRSPDGTIRKTDFLAVAHPLFKQAGDDAITGISLDALAALGRAGVVETVTEHGEAWRVTDRGQAGRIYDRLREEGRRLAESE